jgi:sialate O-acetylesterase
MVVQRGVRFQVSGTATDNRKFDVTFAGQRIEVQPSEGAWNAEFDVSSRSAGSAEISIDGGRLVRKVQVGDVWLCSGQSNMALTVGRASDGPEIVRLANNKNIYGFSVPKPTTAPQQDAEQWVAITPESAKNFSAVCLAFGGALRDRLDVPIGLIDASLGGSWIESWMSAESFRRAPSASSSIARYEQRTSRQAAQWKKKNIHGFEKPSQLFDQMISPLRKLPIKGVLWYQGEGNRQNADSYAELLSILIKDWRLLWNNPEMPFVVVQLPGFGKPTSGMKPDHGLAGVRDAQRTAVAASQPAGLVVTHDLGDGTIHPGTKLPFGRRAADVAFDLVYGQRREGFTPMPTQASFEGKAVRIEFSQGRACLEETRHLAETVYVAGDDRQWRLADVQINRSSIVARSAQVPRPVALRYAWSDYPRVGLKTCENDVPVSPFRTDNWPLNQPSR